MEGRAFCSLQISVGNLSDEWAIGFESDRRSYVTCLLLEIFTDDLSNASRTSGQLGNEFKSTLPDEKSLDSSDTDFSNTWQNLDAKYLRTN